MTPYETWQKTKLPIDDILNAFKQTHQEFRWANRHEELPEISPGLRKVVLANPELTTAELRHKYVLTHAQITNIRNDRPPAEPTDESIVVELLNKGVPQVQIAQLADMTPVQVQYIRQKNMIEPKRKMRVSLTEEQAKEIKARRASAESIESLMRHYNVSRNTIFKALR